MRPHWRIRSCVASHSWIILPLTEAMPGHRSAMGVMTGLMVPPAGTSVMVVPEWTLRLTEPLYWSTTADSNRYQFPSLRTGAFARDQTTNLTAAVVSATIPVWEMEGDGGAVSATTLPSTVTHSPVASASRVFALPGPPVWSPCIENSLASSLVTVRSASPSGTPNSSTRRLSLVSIAVFSTAWPRDTTFWEILSAVAEKSIVHLQEITHPAMRT